MKCYIAVEKKVILGKIRVIQLKEKCATNVVNFRNVCKSKQVDNAKYQQKYRKGKYVHHAKNDSDDEYAFTVGNKKYKGDEIEIEVGGIQLKVVIGSRASVNIISSLLWEDLIEQTIKCKSEKSNKKLYAYGSDIPLNGKIHSSGAWCVKAWCKHDSQ